MTVAQSVTGHSSGSSDLSCLVEPFRQVYLIFVVQIGLRLSGPCGGGGGRVVSHRLLF